MSIWRDAYGSGVSLHVTPIPFTTVKPVKTGQGAAPLVETDDGAGSAVDEVVAGVGPVGARRADLGGPVCRCGDETVGAEGPLQVEIRLRLRHRARARVRGSPLLFGERNLDVDDDTVEDVHRKLLR